MKRLFLIAALTSTCLYGSLAQGDFARIDRLALQAPVSAEVNVDSLVAYFQQVSLSENELARACFIWITHHVAYNQFKAYNPHSEAPLVVLRRRLALCEGYANLFQYFCQKAGLQAYVVKGLTRNYGPTKLSLEESNNHSWNVFRAEGQWYICDPTLAAGGIDIYGEFHFQFKPEYFMPTPEKFLETHWPEDPLWQLNPYPVPFFVFRQGPEAIHGYLAHCVSQAMAGLDWQEDIEALRHNEQVEREYWRFRRIKTVRPARIREFTFAAWRYAEYLRSIGEQAGEADAYPYWFNAIKRYEEALEGFSQVPEASAWAIRCRNRITEVRHRMQHSLE